MTGPLAGTKVIDVTTTFLGPYCTYLLAQMGAEVIKIESPSGDITRSLRSSADARVERSFMLNRGKKSLAVDLKRDEGQEALAMLVGTADVFVHNMRNSAASRLGLDYESIRAVNPSIVYCGATGYGRGGPYEDYPAYDDIIQAASGLAWLQGSETGIPRFMNTIIADKTGGLTALYGVLAALIHRERTGEGQCVDVAMFETMVAYVMAEHLGGMGVEPPIGPPGYSRVVSPYRRPYETQDGFIAVMAYTDAHWQRFCQMAGRMDLARDPDLSKAAGRITHLDRVYETIAGFLADQTTEEALARLAEVDIPAVRVNSLEDLFHDPHLEAVGFFELTTDPDSGDVIRNMQPSARFSASPHSPMMPTPRLGQHSVETLETLGFTADHIERLIGSGVVIDGRIA